MTHTTTSPITLTANAYTLELSAEKIGVYIAGEHIATLDPRTALNTVAADNGTNVDDEELDLDFAENFSPSGAVYTWTSKSAIWEKKVYTLTCHEDRAEYSVTVYGKGDVDSVNYFGGKMSDPCHGSEYDFAEGYHPVIPMEHSPDFYTYRTMRDYAPFSYLSVPPMFFHAFRTEEVAQRLVFGLVAEMGQHNFTRFDYRTSMHRWGCKFWLSTNQDGHTHVDGSWTTPKIVIYTADSNAEAAKKYADLYFDSGICSRGDSGLKPRWWYGPICCGWLEQLAVHYAHDTGLIWGSKQSMYETMADKFFEKDLHPTVMIIDDKWQDQYGTACASPDRWPDLRGFIDGNMKKGIRTFMWYKMWDNEGVPEEYCVWDDNENRYVVDPSNPGYQAILKENIRRIISSEEGCYNAAGLKIDFAFWQPLGRGAKTYSGAYGVELFYLLVKQIREYMKEIKPDAVLNASPCHPIFASLVDQARLHDYDYRQRDSLEEFGERAFLFSTALPNALIDTDGCGYNTRRDTMRYLTRCGEIGIPDMYCISDTPYLSLSNDDWKAVAQAWHDYEKKIDKMFE